MLKWLKAHIVDDARDALKWFSVQASAIALALPVAWPQLPQAFQSAIPGGLVTAMAAASLLAIVGRLVRQGSKDQ